MAFRVIIAGSRTFSDYELLKDRMLYLLSNKDLSNVTILSGGARGADSLGERFAREHGCGLEVHRADWDRFGRSAGYKRNVEMAEADANALIAFWDGSSLGTKHMIQISSDRGLQVRVVSFYG
jgi:hypothetical protein